MPSLKFTVCFHHSYYIQSTPRDDDEAAMRATPGVVFQGHQRPSTVTGQVADYKQVHTENVNTVGFQQNFV